MPSGQRAEAQSSQLTRHVAFASVVGKGKHLVELRKHDE